MNVLLLSAGYGKRLGKLTSKNPKCLIKIENKTLLDYWIEKLNVPGIKKIYINIHFKANLIKNHINKYHSQNKKIILLYEKKLLGTSKTISNNINLFNKDKLLLIHSDNFTSFNIIKLINISRKIPKKCFLTMLSFKTFQPEKTGTMIIDKNKMIKSYYHKDKKSKSRLGNAAIYILNKSFLNTYKKNYSNYYDFSKDVIPKIINKIFVYSTAKFFIDIGDTYSLEEARKWAKLNMNSKLK